eukprot:CFRG4601T1
MSIVKVISTTVILALAFMTDTEAAPALPQNEVTAAAALGSSSHQLAYFASPMMMLDMSRFSGMPTGRADFDASKFDVAKFDATASAVMGAQYAMVAPFMSMFAFNPEAVSFRGIARDDN